MGWFKQAPDMPPELAKAISSHGRLLDWANHSDGLIAITKNSLVDISGDGYPLDRFAPSKVGATTVNCDISRSVGRKT